jgi:hypothetical protein
MEESCQSSLTEIVSDRRLHGQSDQRLHVQPERETHQRKALKS